MDINAISQVAGVGLDIATAVGNIGSAKRQHKRTKELMDISQRNQKELNNQQYDNSKKFWDETNYDDQVREMEKAGLNVGMMYGGGGSAGQTTSMSAGSAASASGGTGIPLQGGQGMDIANKIANIEVMKASADKMRAEAENLRGSDRENTEADTEVKTMQAENLKIANNIANQTIDEAIMQVRANADKAQSEMRSSLVGANIDEATQKSKTEKINSEAINEAFKLTLMKSDVGLNNERARAVSEELAIEWEKLSIELERVGIGKMQNAIQEFTAKVNARLGQGNLNMRGIEAGLNATGRILGGRGSGRTHTTKYDKNGNYNGETETIRN